MLLSTSAPTGSTAMPVGFAGYMMLQMPGGLNAICDQIRSGDVEDILVTGYGIARELANLCFKPGAVMQPSRLAENLYRHIGSLAGSESTDVKGVRKQVQAVATCLRLVPDDQYGQAAASFVRSCGVYLSSRPDTDRRIDAASIKRLKPKRLRILLKLYKMFKMYRDMAIRVGRMTDKIRLAEILEPEGEVSKLLIDEGYRLEALGWKCAANIETFKGEADTALVEVFHIFAMLAFSRAGKPDDAEKEYEKIKRLRGARTVTAPI